VCILTCYRCSVLWSVAVVTCCHFVQLKFLPVDVVACFQFGLLRFQPIVLSISYLYNSFCRGNHRLPPVLLRNFYE
jgi:hypothetical protein